jgi:hypothetical protein
MAEREEMAEEPLGIMDAINELWNRAKTDQTTSQRMESISPADAAKYRQLKAVGVKTDRILQILEQDRKERAAEKSAVKRGVMQILKGIGWLD